MPFLYASFVVIMAMRQLMILGKVCNVKLNGLTTHFQLITTFFVIYYVIWKH